MHSHHTHTHTHAHAHTHTRAHTHTHNQGDCTSRPPSRPSVQPVLLPGAAAAPEPDRCCNVLDRCSIVSDFQPPLVVLRSPSPARRRRRRSYPALQASMYQCDKKQRCTGSRPILQMAALSVEVRSSLHGFFLMRCTFIRTVTVGAWDVLQILLLPQRQLLRQILSPAPESMLAGYPPSRASSSASFAVAFASSSSCKRRDGA